MSNKRSIPTIQELSQESIAYYQQHWDQLVHPTGSLGRLEDLGIQLCSIFGELPSQLGPKLTLVMCADNGILEEDVSSSPKHLTQQLALEMLQGQTGLTALSKWAGADYWVVDLGIEDFPGHPDIKSYRIANGSQNFMKEDAMSRQEAEEALQVGMDLASQAVDQGYMVLGTGELGMGNTTTSAAVIAGLTGAPAQEVVGLGSGVNEQQYQKKIKVVEEGLRLRQVDADDPIDLAAKVGGFDILALAGVFLAGASFSRPIVIDGIISSAAALLAYHLDHKVKDFLVPSHLAKEKGGRLALETMGLRAYLDLEMRLGEGAACPLVYQLMEASLACMNGMSHFDQAGIENNLVNIRDEKRR